MALRAVDQSRQAINSVKGSLRQLREQAALAARRLGFHRVRQRLAGVVSSLTALGRRIAPLTALGGAFSVGAFAAIIRRTAELGDSLGKMSKRSGFAVERLQALQFAAEREGVEAAQFSTAIREFTRNIGEAANGVGEARPVFDALGVSLTDASGRLRDSHAIFGDVADAVKRIEDPATRAAIAQKLMGESGGRMALVLAGGRTGLAAYAEEAERYGLITADQAKASETFIDRLTNLGRSLRGIATLVTAELLPRLNPLIARLTDWIVANRALVVSKITVWIKNIARELATIDVAGIIAGLRDFFGWLGIIRDALGGWLKTLIVVVAAIYAGLIVALVSLARSLVMAGIKSGIPILRLLGAVARANPIGLLVTFLAGAATAIWANWEWLIEKWRSLDLLAPVRKQVAKLTNLLPDWVVAKLGLKTDPEPTSPAVASVAPASGLPDAAGRIGEPTPNEGSLAALPTSIAPLPSFADAPAATAARIEVLVRGDNLPAGVRLERPRVGGDAPVEASLDVGRGGLVVGGD